MDFEYRLSLIVPCSSEEDNIPPLVESIAKNSVFVFVDG